MVSSARQHKGSRATKKKAYEEPPRAATAGVVLLTHDGLHLVMPKNHAGELCDFSAPVPNGSDVKVVALLALEVATGLTMDQLGGETEALLGSTFLEAPHRRTRELFVVKLTEDLQIPDELH